jgi:hypothetical protein
MREGLDTLEQISAAEAAPRASAPEPLIPPIDDELRERIAATCPSLTVGVEITTAQFILWDENGVKSPIPRWHDVLDLIDERLDEQCPPEPSPMESLDELVELALDRVEAEALADRLRAALGQKGGDA